MSRVALSVLFFLITAISSAQDLKGIIQDRNSGKPLSGISIRAGAQITYSDAGGKFSHSKVNVGDTVIFSSVGYLQLKHIAYRLNNRHLVIFMEQKPILLDEAKVYALRDPTADSIRLREEFASAFNYGKPKLKDIFIPKNYASNVPRPYHQANNSTASLISIDVLSVLSLLGKNNAPRSRLQKKLIKEEEDRYVDKVFSRRKIKDITGLSGDSLQNFIHQYRPDADALSNMSEYDFIMYVKTSYDRYIKKRD